MNTYLIPWASDCECDILKINANSYAEAQEKVINYYANHFDSDELAGFDNFDEFSQELYDRFDTFIGVVHEIEEYE